MTVSYEVDIENSLEKVFTYISSPLNDHQWKKRVISTAYVNGDDIKKGLVFEQKIKFLFAKIHFYFFVADYKKNESFTIVSIDSSCQITQKISVKSNLDGGCHLDIFINETVNNIFLKWSSTIIRKLLLKAIQQDCDNLKAILYNKS
ncbi:hypothetical protein D7030_04830 [Flavobacteriaceae bacterium AU392]|nr:hypothetical protein D1817_11305 [Flavobacteriaceae bacterium]RKM86000.1 hypothetical protein D7030_04830 [Flavobacteriaceae bacterium AU392]